MKLKNRIKYAGMAAALALSLTTSTFAAAGVTENNPAPYDRKNSAKGGDTIISVYETTVNTGNLSVEVPLYLTLAVVKEGGGDAKLVPPGNYYIKNTSKNGDKSADATYAIGVTGVHIDSMSGGWILLNYGSVPSGDVQQMTLNFTGTPWEDDGAGGWQPAGATSTFGFPAVGQGKSYSVDTFRMGGNLFSTGTANGTNNTYNPIPPQEALAITIDGKVPAAYSLKAAGQPAVPQFRVTYTVSALDDDNQPIGAPYAGKIYGPYPNAGLLDKAGFDKGDYDSNFTDSKPNP